MILPIRDQSGVDDAILQSRAARGLRVGDARECNMVVKRRIDAGQQTFER